MANPPSIEPVNPADGPRLPKRCPSCGGAVAAGYLGTNGTVFWSEKKHFLGVTGDEVLISRAIVRTNYLPAVQCASCGFVGFFPGSEDADDAEAIVNDATNAPED